MKIKRRETVAEFFDAIVVAELKNYLSVMTQYEKNPPSFGCYFKDPKKDMKRIKRTIEALKLVLREYGEEV